MNNPFIQTALQSDFYKNKLKGVALECWDDIPFTTKKELREADAYTLLGTQLENIASYHETSGTTGKPTSCWYSYEDVEREALTLIESELRLNSKDLLLNRMTFTVAVASFIFYWACQKSKAGHISLAKSAVSTPVRVLEVMARTNPSILVEIPFELEILAGAARRLGIPLPGSNLRALLVAGELLPPSRKKWLETLWGVPVFGLFGTTETGGLYVTCKNGHFHLNNPNVKLEVVDDNGHLVGNGTRGNCVLSTIRDGMPVLRYANQDIVEIREASYCGCGCEDPVLIHYGRKEDMVTINGKTHLLYDVIQAVYQLPSIPMSWRIHVFDDRIEFEYQSIDGSDNEKDRLSTEKVLGNQLNCLVRAYYSELIPETSLTEASALTKFSYIVRHETPSHISHSTV